MADQGRGNTSIREDRQRVTCPRCLRVLDAPYLGHVCVAAVSGNDLSATAATPESAPVGPANA